MSFLQKFIPDITMTVFVLLLKDGLWYLAGITSFGSGCAKPGFPDVFVRISEYTDWIQELIQIFFELLIFTNGKFINFF
jgi:secreted trypsin-like serine protease